MITTIVFNYNVRLQLSEPSSGQQVWSDEDDEDDDTGQ